jgi:t-SNARE complex subunit (syntaxin)
MIEEIKRIEDLIRRKTELLEDIPTNVKEKKLVLLKTC